MMNPLIALAGLVLMLQARLSIAADDEPGPDTAAEQYAALLAEYRPSSAWLRGAETDLQRKEGVERMGSFAPRFLELAEKFPDDPIALQALKQAIQISLSTDSGAQTVREMNESHFPKASDSEFAGRAISALLRDHLESEELGPICDRMRYAYRLEYVEFLSSVLRENPHRDVQGIACIALAQFLNDRLRMLGLADDRPELVERFETLFGEEYLAQIRRRVRVEDVEALFERAVEEYGDVRLVFGGTVGAKAESELYELRNLSVGMTAPEIEGDDEEGESFKLSDYRGKVVLLYFWMEI